MMLSKYFSMQELTISEVAARSGIDNVPTNKELEQLTKTAKKLDTVRELLNTYVVPSSGFRCLALNRKIGSSDTSQHIKGMAVDFTSPNFGTPRQIVEAIKNSNIVFDQLILEFDSWVHISFVDAGNHKQILIIDRSGTRSYV